MHETSSSSLCCLLSGATREFAGIARPKDVREQISLQTAWTAIMRDGVRSQDTPRTTGQPTRFEPTTGVAAMTIHLSLGPLVSLIAGILILIMPRLLNFIVAIYLIVIGLIGLFGMGSAHF
ncbi:hypothetical protein CBA19CS11_08365 [Caballeronia novacaledonica]|uniref:DUF3096 domain-containing protein n=6 Tax=Caballeronia TaxID=1827195 RepID=A0AA37I7X0_9BURK|nr:hypothetical protein CBA19CS11_08365 [Caballeronia novacaledonica]GJH23859.1 hypothetical protein CBA19CS42_05105 [Caballeronia novacaledonica]